MDISYLHFLLMTAREYVMPICLVRSEILLEVLSAVYFRCPDFYYLSKHLRPSEKLCVSKIKILIFNMRQCCKNALKPLFLTCYKYNKKFSMISKINSMILQIIVR